MGRQDTQQSGKSRSNSKEKRDKIKKRELLNSDVEAAWRDGGALLEGATQEAVTRTVRGTIQVARHYATLIEQQKFNFGKYGKGKEVPSRTHTHAITLTVTFTCKSAFQLVTLSSLTATVKHKPRVTQTLLGVSLTFERTNECNETKRNDSGERRGAARHPRRSGVGCAAALHREPRDGGGSVWRLLSCSTQ